jgi:hypothetical protein
LEIIFNQINILCTGYVSIEDVNAWEFTKDLGFSESKIKSLFAKCKPVKGGLGMAEFERLVHKYIYIFIYIYIFRHIHI